MGAAVAAPASLSLTEAQQLAIERSPQMAAYDAAITAARDLAVAPAQLPESKRQIGIAPLAVEDEHPLSSLLGDPTREEVTQLLWRTEAACVQKVEAVEEVEGWLSHRVVSAPRRGARLRPR